MGISECKASISGIIWSGLELPPLPNLELAAGRNLRDELTSYELRPKHQGFTQLAWDLGRLNCPALQGALGTLQLPGILALQSFTEAGVASSCWLWLPG